MAILYKHSRHSAISIREATVPDGFVERGLVEQNGRFVQEVGIHAAFGILFSALAEEVGEIIDGSQAGIHGQSSGELLLPAQSLFGTGQHSGPELVGVKA